MRSPPGRVPAPEGAEGRGAGDRSPRGHRRIYHLDVPVERAFSAFTEDFDAVKPREHNMLSVDIAETVLEPRVGGRIYDRGVDGSECQWARVLAIEPPDRIVFARDISPDWQIQTVPEQSSEVEIRFLAHGPDRTRVELEHRNLERHGENWPALGGALNSDGGWPPYLGRLTDQLARD